MKIEENKVLAEVEIIEHEIYNYSNLRFHNSTHNSNVVINFDACVFVPKTDNTDCDYYDFYLGKAYTAMVDKSTLPGDVIFELEEYYLKEHKDIFRRYKEVDNYV